jgi:hypothetical protein
MIPVFVGADTLLLGGEQGLGDGASISGPPVVNRLTTAYT